MGKRDTKKEKKDKIDTKKEKKDKNSQNSASITDRRLSVFLIIKFCYPYRRYPP